MSEEVGVPNRRWHQELGHIVRYFFPFGLERLSIADDEAIKHIAVKNAYSYQKPSQGRLWMARILGEGLFFVEGDEHVQLRKAAAPAFSTSAIKALVPVFWQKGFYLSNLWQQKFTGDSCEAKSIQILPWLSRATLDIIGAAGCGSEFGSLNDPKIPIREAYRAFFQFSILSQVFHNLASFLPGTRQLLAQMNDTVQRSTDIIRNTATEIIQEKQCSSYRQEKGLVALMVRQTAKLNATEESNLGLETMREQAMTFIGAGHETSATAAAWTLHLLSTHLEVQDRLRAEIQETLPFLFGRRSREDYALLEQYDVDQLPYLNNVCRKSLRYIPPAPGIVRKTIGQDRLGGFLVPPDTPIFIYTNTIHCLPQFWGSNANSFDPGRWDNLPANHPGTAYLSFWLGLRGCIGWKFAETELKVLLICLLSKFCFQQDDKVENPEKEKLWRLVMRPKNGIVLKLAALNGGL